MRKSPLIVLFAAALSAGFPALAVDHPLAPLSHQEIWRTLVLLRDGSIEVRVGATGILAYETTAATSAERPTPAAGPVNPGAADALLQNASADAYGRFVQENVVAINHDHYFSFRLDIDGTDNRFVADRLVARSLPDGHPRRSLWVQEPRVASSEHEARLNMDLNRPTLWRVQSTSRRNAVGYPTSFQVMPGRNTNTLLSADDYPRRRAGFIDHHLWVTPQRDGERFAAGDHPTLSEPGARPALTSTLRGYGPWSSHRPRPHVSRLQGEQPCASRPSV